MCALSFTKVSLVKEDQERQDARKAYLNGIGNKIKDLRNNIFWYVS